MKISEIKEILKKYHARPLKQLGQNFLISKNILNKIIEAANISKNDVILEIGPGLGILTEALAKHAGRVLAVEKDKKYSEFLTEKFRGFKDIQIIHGDILKLKIENLPSFRAQVEGKLKTDYKVVSNLPYNIAARVIRKFLENPPAGRQPKEMILMVQKEVAQRIMAKPPKMNLLAISVRFYATPKIIIYAPKNNFWPQPKVDSAIIKLSEIKKPNISEKEFFKIVKVSFSSKRKQLKNSLSKIFNNARNLDQILKSSGISPLIRPENLDMPDWLNLYQNFKNSGML